MIETETLLEICLQCGARPVAAKLLKARSPQIEIRLRPPRLSAKVPSLLGGPCRLFGVRWRPRPRPTGSGRLDQW
jgi:hypothetical protein